MNTTEMSVTELISELKYHNGPLSSFVIEKLTEQRDEIINLKAYARHERSLGAEPWMMRCQEMEQQLEDHETLIHSLRAEVERLKSKVVDQGLVIVQRNAELSRNYAEVEVLKGEASKWQSLCEANIKLNEHMSKGQSKPDCRVCQRYGGPTTCTTVLACVNGTQFQPSESYPLWRTE